MAVDAARTIDGTFGSVYLEKDWLTNFNEMKAEVEIQKSELKLSGDRWTRHKVVGLKGTGNITGYKVTSQLISLNSPVADNTSGSVRTELVSKLADPEAYGYERIRLMNVMFDKILLANWKAGEVVNEEWPFTFEGYELLDPIVQS
jgi:hypothetical protein